MSTFIEHMVLGILAGLLAAVTGCAGGYQLDYLPQQDEVIQTLASLYELPIADVPPIAWIRGECLYHRDGHCVDGRFREESLLEGPEQIEIAVPNGARWADVPLAHELCHVRQLRKFADSDQEHAGPCFNNPGETGQQEHGLTERGNLAIVGFGTMVLDTE